MLNNQFIYIDQKAVDILKNVSAYLRGIIFNKQEKKKYKVDRTTGP